MSTRSSKTAYKPNVLTQKFLDDLEKERSCLTADFPLCALLIEEAIDRIYTTGRIPGREMHADLLKQKPMKLAQRVHVPIKEYPKFNFTGKILGPKGNSLMRLQEETQCKIMIKGRGSMRDKGKEEELRKSNDLRYSHLKKDLFVEISTLATPAESYGRIAYALTEIRKYLIPDKNDEISHEQLREIMEIDPNVAKAGYGGKPGIYKRIFDKHGGSKNPPEYLQFIKKRALQEEREDLEEEAEYEPVFQAPRKRVLKSFDDVEDEDVSDDEYEYVRVPTSSKHAVPLHTKTKQPREDLTSSKRFTKNPTNMGQILKNIIKYKEMNKTKNNA